MDFKSIKAKYNASSLLMRIIYINIAFFVILRLGGMLSFLAIGNSDTLVRWFELPSNLWSLAMRPWTIVTYMFSHYDVLHILFNMLWLYWLGRIFLECFNPKQLVALYVLGGVAGAALYVVAYNLLPHLSSSNSWLIGASASVMAIVIAISVYRPDYQISLLFIGGISLKWVAIATVFIDLIGIESANFGGHIAHIGGMLVGLWFGMSIKRGRDITAWFNRSVDWMVARFKGHSHKPWKPIGGKSFKSSKSSQSSSSSNNTNNGNESSNVASSTVDESRLDDILGKLKRSGYDALSDDEKEFLFNASRKR